MAGTLFSSSQRRKQDDERFSLTAHEYLERYHIQIYLSDCIRTILDARDEKPLETALKYYNSVLQGNHVLLREFEFINVTPRNRLAFVRLVVESFRSFSPEAEMDVDDHYQKVTLLCVNFPSDYHKEVLKCIREYSVNPTKGAAPLQMISALWQVVFVFNEFLTAVKELYHSSDEKGGEGKEEGARLAVAGGADRDGGDRGRVKPGLERAQFLWSVRNIINTRHWHFSCPAAALLESIIAATPSDESSDISFTQLVLGMSRCESLLIVAAPAASSTPSAPQSSRFSEILPS